MKQLALIDLLPNVLAIAQRAGEKIVAIRSRLSELNIQSKQDNSPVTEADWQAHSIIEEGLCALTPEIPQLSEESEEIGFATRSHWEQYWLIDPLDGTKEFIAGTAEFTINIALIHHGEPILGVIYIPVSQHSYVAVKDHGSFFCEKNNAFKPINARHWLNEKPNLVISRRHQSTSLLMQELLNEFPDYTRTFAGSSLKFCLLAEGRADIYPRFAPTSEWDTAAGQCILEVAGGAVLDLNANPLRYNTKESLLNPSFIAVADASHDWLSLCEKIRSRI